MSPKITQAQRESKRRKILEAAKRAFIRQGYQITTMKDIVKESGLSHGGVYLYFSSTEEMLLDIIDELDRENDQQIEELLAQYPTVTLAVDALFGHLQAELEDIQKGIIPALYEAMMSEWRKMTYVDLMNSRYEKAIERNVHLLQEGVNRGEFRPLLPVDTLARVFITINDGLMVEAIQFGPERARTAIQINAFRQTFKHLLGIREEAVSEQKNDVD